MEANKRLFVSFTGALIKWDDNAYLVYADIYNEGFIKKLKPNINIITSVATIISANPQIDVYCTIPVLTDHKTMKKEVKAWLDKYLPQIGDARRIHYPLGKALLPYLPTGDAQDAFVLSNYSVGDYPSERTISVKNVDENTSVICSEIIGAVV